VINACLTACERRSIDHYHKKSQSEINNMDTVFDSDQSDNNDISVSFIGILFNIILRIMINVFKRMVRQTIVAS